MVEVKGGEPPELVHQLYTALFEIRSHLTPPSMPPMYWRPKGRRDRIEVCFPISPAVLGIEPDDHKGFVNSWLAFIGDVTQARWHLEGVHGRPLFLDYVLPTDMYTPKSLKHLFSHFREYKLPLEQP